MATMVPAAAAVGGVARPEKVTPCANRVSVTGEAFTRPIRSPGYFLASRSRDYRRLQFTKLCECVGVAF